MSDFKRTHNLKYTIPRWKSLSRLPMQMAGMHMLMQLGSLYFAYRLEGAGLVDRRMLQQTHAVGHLHVKI